MAVEAVFVGQAMMNLLSISAVCLFSLMLLGTTLADSSSAEGGMSDRISGIAQLELRPIHTKRVYVRRVRRRT